MVDATRRFERIIQRIRIGAHLNQGFLFVISCSERGSIEWMCQDPGPIRCTLAPFSDRAFDLLKTGALNTNQTKPNQTTQIKRRNHRKMAF